MSESLSLFCMQENMLCCYTARVKARNGHQTTVHQLRCVPVQVRVHVLALVLGGSRLVARGLWAVASVLAHGG